MLRCADRFFPASRLQFNYFTPTCCDRLSVTESGSGKMAAKSGPKGKGKGKKGAKQNKGSKKSDECVEIYLNGGETPADVMVLTAWDEAARTNLLAVAKKGALMKVNKVFIKEHTENSAKWTTSRHSLCGVVDSSSVVSAYDGAATWLGYHPTTRIPSLQFLPHNTFVCIAGMVLSPGPVQTRQSVDGQDVPVTNFHIRAKDGMVKVEAWREFSDYAKQVTAGQIYFFENMKKISPDPKDLSRSVVRYQKSTSHYGCDEALTEEIKSVTADSHEGATTISPTIHKNTRRDAESYKVVEAEWVSLSVVANIIAGKESRSLEGAVQVPSVLLKPVGEKITYLACAACGKSVYETKSCQCETTETEVRFKAKLRMEDNTYQVNATIFEAMDSIVKLHADGDIDKEKPKYYHEEQAHVDEFSMAVEAVPCTVLLAFQENSYTEQIEVSVKAVEPTFNVKAAATRHPMKPILRCAQTLGSSSTCPACAVADTSFEEGAGVTLVPGGSCQKFRALLKVEDKQAVTQRVEDGARVEDSSPAVRCSRKVSCALRGDASTATYTVNAVGPLSFATRLLTPRKGELLHAIVSWKSTTQLALLAFVVAAESPEEATAFAKFFEKETNLVKIAAEEPSKSLVEFASEDTPTKKLTAAKQAARDLASPEPWAKRTRCA